MSKIVILDAANGGENIGAYHNGFAESECSIVIVKIMKKMLESVGVKVILTRENDEYIPLRDRVDIINKNPNSIVVSVGMGYSSNDEKDFSIYANSIDEESTNLAKCISAQEDGSDPIYMVNYLSANIEDGIPYALVHPGYVTSNNIENFDWFAAAFLLSVGITNYINAPTVDLYGNYLAPEVIPGQLDVMSIENIKILDASRTVLYEDVNYVNGIAEPIGAVNTVHVEDGDSFIYLSIYGGDKAYRLQNGFFYIPHNKEEYQLVPLTEPNEPNDIMGRITVNFNGLAVHSTPEWMDNNIWLLAKEGLELPVVAKIGVSNGEMYEIKGGLWITASPKYVTFHK